MYSWFMPGIRSLAPGTKFTVLGPIPKIGDPIAILLVNPQITCLCQSGKASVVDGIYGVGGTGKLRKK